MTKTDNLHIVIAEDDIEDGEIILQSFERNVHFAQVHLVQNGQELLSFLKNAAQVPDVILTDINMPIMSGIEALKAISEDDRLRDIHAFVYSTTINPTYKARCMELGIEGFLIKPFTIEAFDEIPKEIVTVLSTGIAML
jgi:CheY-like chemotaxis protein